MWTRVFDDHRVWAGALVFGVLLFLGEIASAAFGDGSATPHLLQSLLWLVLTPLWFVRYRRTVQRRRS